MCTFNGGGAVPGMTQNVLIDNWGGGFGVGQTAGKWIQARRNESHDRSASWTPRRRPRRNGPTGSSPAWRPLHRKRTSCERARERWPRVPRLRLTAPRSCATTAVAPAIGAAGGGRARFVGSVGIDSRALRMIDGDGAFRIAWSFYEVLSGVRLLDDVERCLSGQHVVPERMLMGGGVTPPTVKSYRRAVADPLATSTRPLYARVMRDCTCQSG